MKLNPGVFVIKLFLIKKILKEWQRPVKQERQLLIQLQNNLLFQTRTPLTSICPKTRHSCSNRKIPLPLTQIKPKINLTVNRTRKKRLTKKLAKVKTRRAKKIKRKRIRRLPKLRRRKMVIVKKRS
jgi:hypothetical protein